LEAYEVYKQHVNANCELVVPEYLFEWQKRSLDLLGYDDGSYVKWKYRHAQANILVLGASRKFLYGNDDDPLSPSSLKWLRNRLLKSKKNSQKKSKRIFISRKDSQKCMRIKNEDHMSAFLHQHGFCTYQLTDLSLDEQINLFSGAEIIVATHGAGLTNLIFSDASYVIEIFQEGNFRKDFYAIATIIGSNYIAVNASACPKREGFCVDIKCLEEILQECKI
jgi:capsular polysaccharide biosynthesis protein